MSWSTYTVGLAADIDARLDALQVLPAGAPERDQQIAVAKAAAKTILASGAVGDVAFTVSIAGHSNPGHQPTAGYANEMIVVNIGAVDIGVVETFDANAAAAKVAAE